MTEATAFRKSAAESGINQDCRQKFLSLYPNRAGWISKLDDENWTTPSVPRRLSDGMILRAVRGDIDIAYGAKFAENSNFAVLDIDAGSQYHNTQALIELRNSLAIAHLVSVLYRSSESGGWHLYIFFDKEENTGELQERLTQWLKLSGYRVEYGQLEVFPSKSQALRLPLQRGFAWLEQNIERDQVDTDQALAMFFRDQEQNQNNWQKTKNVIVPAILDAQATAHVERIDVSAIDIRSFGRNEELWQEGRKLYQTGLQQARQRHRAVVSIGHYLWYGDDHLPALPGRQNDMQRYRLILEFLKEKHNGFCRHINRGRWKRVEQEILGAVTWRPPSDLLAQSKYEPYKETERVLERRMQCFARNGYVLTTERAISGNNKREQAARSKIEHAVKKCLRSKIQITLSSLRDISGCSAHTIRKHRDIWAEHSLRYLTTMAGDYSSGGVEGAPGFSGSTCSEEERLLVPVLEVEDPRRDFDPDQFTVIERRSALAPVVALKDLRSQFYIGQLTPCANQIEGEGEQLNGKRHSSLLPPSKYLIIATGSIAGAHFVCRSFSTCGINGQPPHEAWVPSHLILGNFCCGALRSLLTSLCRSRMPAAIFCTGAQDANLTASGRGPGQRNRAPPVVLERACLFRFEARREAQRSTSRRKVFGRVHSPCLGWSVR